MSLRVDLITPEEHRSGYAISMKSCFRVTSILIPVVVLFLLGSFVFNTTMTGSELRVMESRWQLAEPKQKHALKLMGRLNYNRDTLEELQGWAQGRIDWNKQLLAVIESAPTTIQATSLVIALPSGQSALSSPPSRVFSLSIEGKTSGQDAIRHITAFKNNLESHTNCSTHIDSVKVTYAADPSRDADEFDRVFKLECAYHNPREEAQQ